MKKHTPVIWFGLFLLLVFLTLPTAFAQSNKLLIVDFGSIAPVNKMSPSLPFTLPVTTQAVQFNSSGLSAVKTGHRIPAERLTFSADTITKRRGEVAVYQLKIQLLPSDPPGEYEGFVDVVCPDANGAQPISLLVKVEILPWVRIEPANTNPLLTIAESPFLTEGNLSARTPVKILLASNAPWRLLLRLGSKTPFKAPPFPFQIGIGKTLKTEDFKERMLPNDDYRPVAFGAPTVVGDGSTPANYWTELYCTVSIANWHHYPTGDYDTSMFFAAETVVP